ncbi:sigma-54-dependent transcriptional regulator [Marinobacter sp. SS21]|uniref:sigma-54-dependent transcriptional regulator n=1 Tax=Marinobacter sp. SS21 TaxID=2979460 RepID=UPI00232CAAC2|nr:sigma-54 dependent transcriptional regulator [Marinobacter sp. SS21]MDC0662286.1 sigma-54 dependent transcriptional regulator [Marinobacter sp. SS21]
MTGRVLIVEDSELLGMVYREYLVAGGYDVVHVENGKQALVLLEEGGFDLLVLDLSLPDMHGFEVLKSVQEQQWPVSTIVATGHDTAETAMEAIRLGAADFLTKPVDASRLMVTVGNVLKQHRLEHIVSSYQQQIERDHFEGLIGASPVMQSVYRIIETAAPSQASIFITGESGTGKELCAEAIHRQSGRAGGPLITLNCAAIPKDLMESEIFGHVKGAFTGAHTDREGAASMADGGTLFLDELCEMDLDLQSKLLRFIQSGTFQRVGSGVTKKVDIRFVCATNRDPLAEVKAGRFREDLYYRLHVIPLRLPPLRERGEDILLIAGRMLEALSKKNGKRFEGLAPEVERLMLNYPWPGNVRELENSILNMVVMGDGRQVTEDMVPPSLKHGIDRRTMTQDEPDLALLGDSDGLVASRTASSMADIKPLWLEEKRIIERAIALCDGNVPRAAALLEVSASTVYRKRQSWAAEGL